MNPVPLFHLCLLGGPRIPSLNLSHCWVGFSVIPLSPVFSVMVSTLLFHLPQSSTSLVSNYLNNYLTSMVGILFWSHKDSYILSLEWHIWAADMPPPCLTFLSQLPCTSKNLRFFTMCSCKPTLLSHPTAPPLALSNTQASSSLPHLSNGATTQPIDRAEIQPSSLCLTPAIN